MRRLMVQMVFRCRRTALAAAAALCCFSASGAEVDFLRDIRPILSSHCFKCHGPDEGTRKGGLRLDLPEEGVKPAKSGKAAIVPGKPDASELVSRILTEDDDDLMPPPSAKHPLSAAQKDLLKRWIEAGAEYKPHWAFVKPTQPGLPAVSDGGWPRTGIDYFVMARLDQEGLKPSSRADKYALVRRLYPDLIGLPPAPAEADAFVRDTSENAYERLVDHLLASPHYGERWARRWLDLARYADTNGYEKDRPRSIWPYRDWLIKALNDDMPFDQFTREQIAGDMLPNATTDQIVATGFHRNTMINEEGGIDPLEFRFYAMVDRVHVTATTWLGLTMACAQCHTHKYDPIQHTDYYAFMAFMNNADEPTVPLPDPEIAAERESIEKQIAALEKALPDKFPAPLNVKWTVPAGAKFSSSAGSEGEFLKDGTFRVAGPNPDKDDYTLTFENVPERITHVQLEALPDEQVVQGGPGRTDHGNFVLSEIKLEAEGREIKISEAEADFSQNGFPTANAIDGKLNTGWAVGTEHNRRFHRRAIFTLEKPLQGTTSQVVVRLVQQFGGRHTLGRFRVSFGEERIDEATWAERSRQHRNEKFADWLKNELSKVVAWETARPTEAKSDTPVLTIEEDDGVFVTGDFTKSDTFRLKFKNVPAGARAFRLEALADDRLPRRGPGTVSYEGPEGDFWVSTIKVRQNGEPVKLVRASESFASGGSNAEKAIDEDLQSGWSINGAQGRDHAAVFQFESPLEKAGELEIDITCERYYAAALGRFRISFTREEEARASALPGKAYQLLATYKGAGGAEKLVGLAEDHADRRLLLQEFAKSAPELAEARKEIDDLRRKMPQFATTLVMRERAPEYTRATHRYHRGEFLQPKEKVEPGLPEFLGKWPEGKPKNRLGFAEWLVSPDNPLTARVVMNRHWDAFFGRGLVRTLEDFGFQGELPSHPALLDWLAMEFMKSGWSQKKMHKLIVMSATYQQSSVVTPELLERDPLNVLLARGPRFRVEAELVRDLALTASGLLSPKLGGPSVFPPQPASVTTEGAYGPLTWRVSEGEDRHRRGLYTFAKRTAPFALTLAFDGPSGEACLARRDRANTPLQALSLLNDEVFMEAARALGTWAADQTGKTEEVVEAVFQRCLTRPPSAEESTKLRAFYERQLARFESGELKAAELLGEKQAEEKGAQRAAWTALARVLLNLDETLNKS